MSVHTQDLEDNIKTRPIIHRNQQTFISGEPVSGFIFLDRPNKVSGTANTYNLPRAAHPYEATNYIQNLSIAPRNQTTLIPPRGQYIVGPTNGIDSAKLPKQPQYKPIIS